MTSAFDAIVIPSSSPEQNWARSVSPCTPGRLFGIPPLSSSPPSLPPASELLKDIITGHSARQSPKSPLARNVAKGNALLSTADKRPADESSAKAARSGTSKAKTVRKRKTTKSQETQNKVIKGRVAKATTFKAKQTNDKDVTEFQQKDASRTPEEDRKRAVEEEGLNLDEALRRRLDWTPPKSAPFDSECPFISLDEDGASQSSGAKTSFGNILRDFHYNRESSVPEPIQVRKEGNPTKRRRVELVEFDIQQAKLPQKQQAEKPNKDSEPRKAKVKPRKQPKTITARMTALYEPIDEMPELLSCDEESLDADDVSAKKKTTKRKKKPAKQNEPAYIILSPDAATKSVNDQNFQFGTCSQLERDDSPTFFEETQKALRISESSASKTVSEKISMVSSSRSIATRFTGTKSHWSVAARDFDGSVVQPEVIDMTDSPSTSTAFKRISSDTTRHDVPKAKSPLPSKRIDKPDPIISKDVPIRTMSQRDAQNTYPKSVADTKSSTEQPLTPPSDMPNFHGFTDEELSKQIAAYAFKPIRGRKKMIDLLEKCWQNKHKAKGATEGVEAPLLKAISEATSAASTIVEDQNSKKPSARSRKTKPSDSKPKAASRAAKKKPADKPVTKKTKTPEKPSPPEPRPTTIIVDEIQDSEEEIIPSPTRIRMQRESSRQATPAISGLALGNKGKRTLASSKVSTTSDDDPSLPDLLGQITKAIRLQSRPQHSSQQGQLAQRLTWHEKILLYDPIILEDLATWLNTEGFALVSEDREVSAGFVRGWCESQGICCTYRN